MTESKKIKKQNNTKLNRTKKNGNKKQTKFRTPKPNEILKVGDLYIKFLSSSKWIMCNPPKYLEDIFKDLESIINNPKRGKPNDHT